MNKDQKVIQNVNASIFPYTMVLLQFLVGVILLCILPQVENHGGSLGGPSQWGSQTVASLVSAPLPCL